ELRRQVRGTRSRYVVVKNTLALRASRGTAFEDVSKHFVGPTAVAFNQDDPVALAKVLTAFAKTNPNLVFKGALVEGRAVEASEIKTIAELPSREQLLGRLVFLLQSPLTRLATVLAGPVSNLARVLRAIAEKSTSGPAAAEPAEKQDSGPADAEPAEKSSSGPADAEPAS
ncbi:MAG TPA: 50S ribosomal protein L10, partial [Thermoanaerobaculia bacterium]|nr:50S ribosomal protein L10 [Thermoanaerobaculia bacterium]